jgi:hypothetical protein
MHTAGGCFCGALEYEAEVDDTRVGVCHCRDCQIFSGSAFRMAAVVEPSSFRFTKGTPKLFDKTADSGKVRRMAFCGDCGTHICSLPVHASELGAFVSLRVATSRDFAKIKPTGELWCRSKVAWLPEIKGTLKFDGQP